VSTLSTPIPVPVAQTEAVPTAGSVEGLAGTAEVWAMAGVEGSSVELVGFGAGKEVELMEAAKVERAAILVVVVVGWKGGAVNAVAEDLAAMKGGQTVHTGCWSRPLCQSREIL